MKLPRLKEVRELHGWSQAKLAEESDVSRDSISNYETGQREAWPATAKKLADALHVEIADLREPARELATSGKAEAPKEAGQLSAAEEAAMIEGLASAVDAVADRTQKRNEQTDKTDGDALAALFEDSWLAQRGAEQLLEQVNEEAVQKQRESPGERRARSKLEEAVMRLIGLAENIASELLEGIEELEWADERADLLHLDEARRRRRAG